MTAWAALAAVVACVARAELPYTAPFSQDVQVEVEADPSGGFDLEGRFVVDAPTHVAWSTLVDYDRLPKFVSSMKKSAVVERHGRDLMLEQETVARAFLVNKTLRVVLAVHEDPMQAIFFEDVSRTDLEVYQGSWRLRPRGDGCEVTYTLHTKGIGLLPRFVSRSASAKLVRGLLREVRAEMQRRAGDRAKVGRGRYFFMAVLLQSDRMP